MVSRNYLKSEGHPGINIKVIDQTNLKLKNLYVSRAVTVVNQSRSNPFHFITLPLVVSNNYCKFERYPCINIEVMA